MTAQPYIISFSGEWRALSNFAPVMVTFDGERYNSVENAYQAAKSPNAQHRALCRITTAGNAKRLGRKVQLRHDWEAVKEAIMRDLLQQKFATRTPDYHAGLLRTGTARLIEGNDWNDQYWGCVHYHGGVGQPYFVEPNGRKWFGQNRLGELLMVVREQLERRQPRIMEAPSA